jgi:hypothetical protein
MRERTMVSAEQPILIAGIRPGIQARGLDPRHTAVADWLCSCGHHERATGTLAVQELLARARVGECPHRLVDREPV